MSEQILARFTGNKAVYIRVHVIMAVVGAVIISSVLYLANNPDWWVGIVGSFAGISMRGYYIASEQLGFTWTLTPTRLNLPSGRHVLLEDIENVRSLLGSVQLITREGDKHLIKYQADPEKVIAEINRIVAQA